MWRTRLNGIATALKDGLEVIVRGQESPSMRRTASISSASRNFIRRAPGLRISLLRKLKEKLLKLGYFAPERKKPLPTFPRRIALVTSPTGAAIRDMLEIIAAAGLVPRSGSAACASREMGRHARSRRALERLNSCTGIDVILLGRGGGSSEDLAPSMTNWSPTPSLRPASRSSPRLATRSTSPSPTWSPIAVPRLPAPPQRLRRPDRTELLQAMRARRQRLHDLLVGKYQAQAQRLHSSAQRRVFQFPLERLRDQERRVDEWDDRMQRAIQMRLKRERHKLDAATGRLESLSPLNVLARGYSLTRNMPAKGVVRSIEHVAVGDAIEIVLSDGRLQAAVTAKEANET